METKRVSTTARTLGPHLGNYLANPLLQLLLRPLRRYASPQLLDQREQPILPFRVEFLGAFRRSDRCLRAQIGNHATNLLDRCLVSRTDSLREEAQVQGGRRLRRGGRPAVPAVRRRPILDRDPLAS